MRCRVRGASLPNSRDSRVPVAVPREMGSTRAGDWACPSCNATVFASKRECYLCKTSKPDGEMPLVPGEAAPPLSKPVEQMKMAELRRALEARGLNPASLRPALVARLQQALCSL